MAIGIGVLSAFVALILLRLIGLFTNLFFSLRWDTALVSPAGNHLGLFIVLVPILGALIIGLMAQFFHLSSAERKTLLVAGAAGGMSATSASPVAAVMLAVELLLFEWKPRSLVPVALASAAALVVRRSIIGLGPLFPTPLHPAFIGPVGVLGCVLVGLLAGGLSALLTIAVYASEDAFRRLPIHWMW